MSRRSFSRISSGPARSTTTEVAKTASAGLPTPGVRPAHGRLRPGRDVLHQQALHPGRRRLARLDEGEAFAVEEPVGLPAVRIKADRVRVDLLFLVRRTVG